MFMVEISGRSWVNNVHDLSAFLALPFIGVLLNYFQGAVKTGGRLTSDSVFFL